MNPPNLSAGAVTALQVLAQQLQDKREAGRLIDSLMAGIAKQTGQPVAPAPVNESEQYRTVVGSNFRDAQGVHRVSFQMVSESDGKAHAIVDFENGKAERVGATPAVCGDRAKTWLAEVIATLRGLKPVEFSAPAKLEMPPLLAKTGPVLGKDGQAPTQSPKI